MNDKQKVLLEGLLRLEGAMNKLLRDAAEEKLPIDLMVYNNRVHVSVNQAQFEVYQNWTVVPNDD